MDSFTNTNNFNNNSEKIRHESQSYESKEEIEFEIQNLKNEYQFLLHKDEELDHSLDLIKEKYLQESKRLKWHIKTNEEALLSLQMSSQTLLSDSPMNESKILQREINQLIEDIAKLKENENNLSLSNNILNNEINEIEFLIESIPFNHDNLFKLAEQKIQHQLNNDIINYHIRFSDVESEKESLQIELNIAQSILSKWKYDNDTFVKKINILQQKRKEINQKMNEIKQSNNLNFHTIQLTKLQKRLEQKNEEKEKELNILNHEYESKIQKIESQLSITRFEINERLNAIEELNKKNIELAAEYENAKDNFNKKIIQIKERQLNEIADIKQRFQIEMDKALNNQKKQLDSSIYDLEFPFISNT